MMQQTFSLLLARLSRVATFLLYCASLLVLSAPNAAAMPEFARRYDLSCAACHSAVPRLNEFGEYLADNNMRLPNCKETTDSIGDDRLALPAYPPFAIRAQAYVQARQGEAIDPLTGASDSATTDPAACG